MRVALTEKMVDANVVTDQITDNRQWPMEGNRGVEQTVNGQTARYKIDAEKAREEQVGLTRLNRHAGWDSARIEIPAPSCT